MLYMSRNFRHMSKEKKERPQRTEIKSDEAPLKASAWSLTSHSHGLLCVDSTGKRGHDGGCSLTLEQRGIIPSLQESLWTHKRKKTDSKKQKNASQTQSLHSQFVTEFLSFYSVSLGVFFPPPPPHKVRQRSPYCVWWCRMRRTVPKNKSASGKKRRSRKSDQFLPVLCRGFLQPVKEECPFTQPSSDGLSSLLPSFLQLKRRIHFRPAGWMRRKYRSVSLMDFLPFLTSRFGTFLLSIKSKCP